MPDLAIPYGREALALVFEDHRRQLGKYLVGPCERVGIRILLPPFDGERRVADPVLLAEDVECRSGARRACTRLRLEDLFCVV